MLTIPPWKETKYLILDWPVDTDKKKGIKKCNEIKEGGHSCKIWAIAATIVILALSILAGGFLALCLGGCAAALTYDLHRFFDNIQHLAENEIKNWDAEVVKGKKIKETDYKKDDMKDRYKESLGALCRGTGLLRFVVTCYFDSLHKKLPPKTPSTTPMKGKVADAILSAVKRTDTDKEADS